MIVNNFGEPIPYSIPTLQDGVEVISPTRRNAFNDFRSRTIPIRSNKNEWQDFDNLVADIPDNININRMQIPYRNIGIGAAAAAELYGANALMSGGNERWDRTAINTGGNIVGGTPGTTIGYALGGLPGAVVGGLAGAAMGGYASDRVADMFDSTQGQMSSDEALQLLNQHLQVTSQPYLNEAEARAELMAARQAQREQAAAIRNYREQMMQQYSG